MVDTINVFIWVGMQVDLLPGGPVEVPESQQLVACFNEALAFPLADLVLAANFHLPANHASFAGNHLWRKPGQTIQVEGVPTELKTMYGVQGSFGAEFLPGMKTERITQVFHLGTDRLLAPFSAFFDTNNKPTGLEGYLRGLGRPVSLLWAGMPLDHELKNSVLDSLRLGFPTGILKNASLASDPAKTALVLEELAQAGASVSDFHPTNWQR